VSPDVIPFIRNEARLETYLDDQGADYLVTFPSWYPKLTQGRTALYKTDGEYSLLFGMDQMTVYQWDKTEDQ
jgi:hypothetical protein